MVFTHRGTAVEVSLSDGAVLNAFTSLHDVSQLEQFGEERTLHAAVFSVFGLDYVDGQ